MKASIDEDPAKNNSSIKKHRKLITLIYGCNL